MLKSVIGLIENWNLRFVPNATEFKQLWSLGFADIREVIEKQKSLHQEYQLQ